MEGKMIRTPIILADKDKIKSAYPLEPFADREEVDIIIRNEDGISNTSIYESYKEKLFEDGYISKKTIDNMKQRKIFGFTIDFNEFDPYNAMNYIGDCSDFAPISFTDDITNYGNWGNLLRDFFGVRPCLLDKDNTKRYLSESDYSKLISGDEIDIESGKFGNVFIEFSKKYYKVIMTESTLTFKVANYKVDNTYICDAFLSEDGSGNIEDYMYISPYLGKINNGLMSSLSNKDFTIYSVDYAENMREKITGNGVGYQNLNYCRYMYIQLLTWLVTKSCNSSSIFYSSVPDNYISGSMNNKGLFYRSRTGYKIFGIENFLYYDTIIDGIMVNNEYVKYKINSKYKEISSYKTAINIPVLGYGYISKLTQYLDRIVLPLQLEGTSNGCIGMCVENDAEDDYAILVMTLGGIKFAKYNLTVSYICKCGGE